MESEYILYLGLAVVISILLIYSDGIKEAALNLFFPVILGVIWFLIERLVDQQFDLISLYLFSFILFSLPLFFWLRKEYNSEKTHTKNFNRTKSGQK